MATVSRNLILALGAFGAMVRPCEVIARDDFAWAFGISEITIDSDSDETVQADYSERQLALDTGWQGSLVHLTAKGRLSLRDVDGGSEVDERAGEFRLDAKGGGARNTTWKISRDSRGVLRDAAEFDSAVNRSTQTTTGAEIVNAIELARGTRLVTVLNAGRVAVSDSNRQDSYLAADLLLRRSLSPGLGYAAFVRSLNVNDGVGDTLDRSVRRMSARLFSSSSGASWLVDLGADHIEALEGSRVESSWRISYGRTFLRGSELGIEIGRQTRDVAEVLLNSSADQIGGSRVIQLGGSDASVVTLGYCQIRSSGQWRGFDWNFLYESGQSRNYDVSPTRLNRNAGNIHVSYELHPELNLSVGLGFSDAERRGGKPSDILTTATQMSVRWDPSPSISLDFGVQQLQRSDQVGQTNEDEVRFRVGLSVGSQSALNMLSRAF